MESIFFNFNELEGRVGEYVLQCTCTADDDAKRTSSEHMAWRKYGV